MHTPPGSALPLTRPRLRPDSCRGLLRRLSERQTPWSELATAASRDPLLCWSILGSVPLGGRVNDRDLTVLVESRMTQIGADLLRAWALQESLDAAENQALDQRSAHSLLVAELALHLATEMRYPLPQEAYLAGLWHELGALFEEGDPSGIEDGNPVRRAEHSARLAARAEPGLPLLDAIRLQVEHEDCVMDGHPLSRILWVARVLAEAEPDQRLSTLSRVVGLGPQALLSLRSEVTYLAEDALRGGSEVAKPSGSRLPMVTAPRAQPEDNGAGSAPWMAAAARGLMQGAFIDLSEPELLARLQSGCALLTGGFGPRVVLEMQSDRFVPILTVGVQEDWFEGFELRADNPTSTLALAIRRGEPIRYGGTLGGPGRSTLDWQLDRWLGGGGFTAWPWRVGGRTGLALFAEDTDTSRIAAQRSSLLGAALGELLRERRRIAERTAQQEAARTQFIEKARRLRHEASNPLTLIRSYLDLIGERHSADQKTRADLSILGSEIERIGQMLRAMTGAAQRNDEAEWCQANEVLGDLASLCADTMFASRGVQLDTRGSPELPPIRIPRSVLRQILLNLLRNAAEAVPAGGRVSLSSSGPVSVDGRLCVELRVIDNGPGLSEDRLRNLFSDSGSEKGEGHDGIGLSIVRELLHAHGAAMICRSQPRAGTGMQIFIPVHA